MKKIYSLKSCNTCQRILKALEIPEGCITQDIKEFPISNTDLEHLKTLSGSYEALFSKRARLYNEMGLKNKVLGEYDFKKLILEHYTFLKRPVVVVENQIFIGNSAKTIDAATLALKNEQ